MFPSFLSSPKTLQCFSPNHDEEVLKEKEREGISQMGI
jgi:hypothetical protein